MTAPDSQSEIERLRKRVDRERRARQEAEAIAEHGTRLLYERGRQMQLLYVIADAAGRASSTDAAIQVALDELCQFTGWPIGHAYRVTDEPVYSVAPTSLWHLDHPEQFAAFRDVSEKLSFRRGEGLPGQVLDSGCPVWISDVFAEPNFPRISQAREIGVRGAFAIPVLVGKTVVAVLEFFSREPAAPEESWVDIIAQVGIQVGRTFEREAREQADRANRAKSEFLSRMSHELRTPLNAILGFGQLLEMDDLSSNQRSSVSHILKGGRHLLNLIDEVLDISRIEAGHMHLSPEPVPVSSVLGEALDMIRPLARHRDILVVGPKGDFADRYVLADQQRLKQVLLNLLSNAVKYNREGGSVSVECTESERCLRIGVSDTGAGIPAHKLQQLFMPFERLGAEQSAVEGTGLGLALSKRLTEMMGGNMGVESVHGSGSTFWVELVRTLAPLKKFDSVLQDLEALQSDSPRRSTILYIEDNHSNLQLVERVLSHRPQLQLLAAMRAGMGIDLAVQHQPELILLDLNLPDMSGHEVLVHLQGDPRTCAIPVVVISADATPGQVHRLLAAGAAAYLTKPLDLPKFLQTLDNLLNGSPQRADVSKPLSDRETREL